MRKDLAALGIILLAAGAFAFLISEEIRVRIDVLPFSMALAIIFVAGAIILVVVLSRFVGTPL